MNNQFSTQEYIRMLGKELVFEFITIVKVLLLLGRLNL